jgi:hypothetical protein
MKYHIFCNISSTDRTTEPRMCPLESSRAHLHFCCIGNPFRWVYDKMGLLRFIYSFMKYHIFCNISSTDRTTEPRMCPFKSSRAHLHFCCIRNLFWWEYGEMKLLRFVYSLMEHHIFCDILLLYVSNTQSGIHADKMYTYTVNGILSGVLLYGRSVIWSAQSYKTQLYLECYLGFYTGTLVAVNLLGTLDHL